MEGARQNMLPCEISIPADGGYMRNIRWEFEECAQAVSVQRLAKLGRAQRAMGHAGDDERPSAAWRTEGGRPRGHRLVVH